MKILVLLASYLDTELPYTMKHCIDNADHPENIRFAVVLQHDHHDADVIDHLPYDIVMTKYHHTESQGVGWARNKVAELYTNEEYVLQVDSHSRFASGWDTILLDNINRLPEKSIISYLPWSYLKDRQRDQDLYFVNKDTPNLLTVPKVDKIYGNYFVWYGGYDNVKDVAGKNIRTPFTYGGFIFAPGKWLVEVPPDPDFFYNGEEQSVYLRTFTHGWNIYMPTQNVAWHYSASGVNRAPVTLREKSTAEKIRNLEILSQQRMAELLAGKITGIFGLGNTRSLQEWVEFSGVDFHAQTVIIKHYEQDTNA